MYLKSCQFRVCSCFFFSSRRRHTRSLCDWSSDVCSSDLLDLIIHLERLEDGARRVSAITEVQRMESDVITLQDIFEFRVERVTPERVVIGHLGATGLRPTFLHKFEKRGVSLPVDLFVKKQPISAMPVVERV